jgi:hypothetical protein
MAATALPTRRLPVLPAPRQRLRLVPPAAATLAEVIDTAWAGLNADAPVACPVCDGRMEPRLSAGAGVVGGRCRDCGSELS